MNRSKLSSKRTIAGALTALAIGAGAVALAVNGPATVAFAQTADDGSLAVQWTTGDAYVEKDTGKQKAKAKGGTTPEQICEAEERTKARWAKFLADGTPEQFGSEEPFTFDPSVC